MYNHLSIILLACFSLAGCTRSVEEESLAYAPIAEGHIVVHSDHVLASAARVHIESATPGAVGTAFTLEASWFDADNDRTARTLEFVNLPSDWQRIVIEGTRRGDAKRHTVSVADSMPLPDLEVPPWHWILRHPVLAAALFAFGLYLLSCASSGALFVTQGASSLCFGFLIVFAVLGDTWQWLAFAAYLLCLFMLALTFGAMSLLPAWLRYLEVVLVVGAMFLLHFTRDYEPEMEYIAPGVVSAYVPASLRRNVSLQDGDGRELLAFSPRADARLILPLPSHEGALRMVMTGDEGRTEELTLEPSAD